MARLRREKTWSVERASVEALRTAARGFFTERGVAVASESESSIEGRGGSALKAFMLWTEKTAPFRVRVSFWAGDGSTVEVETVFEEGVQFGKFGPVKNTTYTKMADTWLSDLRGHLTGTPDDNQSAAAS
jgi:hypothetical protein